MSKKKYIDAYALMDLANNHIDKTIDANDIARFPVADVEEVKHGTWLQNPYHNYFFSCSLCGRVVEARTFDSKEVSKSYPYCHCGAEMDRKDNIYQ